MTYDLLIADGLREKITCTVLTELTLIVDLGLFKHIAHAVTAHLHPVKKKK